MEILKTKLEKILCLYDELTQTLSSSDYGLSIPSLPSNKIGQQLWCIGGARESYLDAIVSDSGFKWNCSMKFELCCEQNQITEFLSKTHKQVTNALFELKQLSENQSSLLIDLLEHECQHQGQLIRYVYANRIAVPAGWKAFWALD